MNEGRIVFTDQNHAAWEEPNLDTVRTADGIEHDAVRFGDVSYAAKCALMDAYDRLSTFSDVPDVDEKFKQPRCEVITCIRCLGFSLLIPGQ